MFIDLANHENPRRLEERNGACLVPVNLSSAPPNGAGGSRSSRSINITPLTGLEGRFSSFQWTKGSRAAPRVVALSYQILRKKPEVVGLLHRVNPG